MENQKFTSCPKCGRALLQITATELVVYKYRQYEATGIDRFSARLLTRQPAPHQIEGFEPVEVLCLTCGYQWFIPGPITDLPGWKKDF